MKGWRRKPRPEHRCIVCLYGPTGDHVGTVRLRHLPTDEELESYLQKFRAVHYDIKDR